MFPFQEHKKKYPDESVQVTEISKRCSDKWKTMSDDEKKRFFELAQKDAERYQAEVQAYGGEDMAYKKKKRQKKDPNAPKKALSAFFFFSNDKRSMVQQEHPDYKVGQIAQELGKYWKALSDEERQIYERRAQEDKGRYEEEMRIYRQQEGNNTVNVSGGSSSAAAIERVAGGQNIKPEIISSSAIPQSVAPNIVTVAPGQPLPTSVAPGTTIVQVMHPA
ncbi:HMG (high mobility group) box domain-containing protein [Ditylenchus destructor]|uniref:HMG (High mobility group) box domain-containing protein n=1 Tax=Ditylenchus destructor TaxID=166010 RepID=A0AAD4MKG6_9BILA|nr:HMG (high mobility group) box domain-containing protein [Ditylenchus destructor]